METKKTRIELTDNVESIVMKLSEMNIGAMNAIIEMMKDSPSIDPDSAMGSFAPLLVLDQTGIYGTDIYILWSDICGKCTTSTLAVLRSVQLGFLSSDILVDACSRQDRSGRTMINVKEMYRKVKEMLPNFDSGNTAR